MKFDVLVDMDLTLLEAVEKSDDRFDTFEGEIISYIFENKKEIVKVKIRPYALYLIKCLIDSGHKYIIWSAGVKDYVYAVLNYFLGFLKPKYHPVKILTREDMVIPKGSKGLKKFKSMESEGFNLNKVLIIDDNETLIAPKERERIIRINAWNINDTYDRSLSWIAQYLMNISEV
jgi:2-hydroxy-3-keto-5-methylthiopentenyl-1-phosphate phosphatase